jgi:hypothetical protein
MLELLTQIYLVPLHQILNTWDCKISGSTAIEPLTQKLIKEFNKKYKMLQLPLLLVVLEMALKD